MYDLDICRFILYFIVGEGNFFLQIFQACSVVKPAFYSVGTGFLSRGWSGRNVKLTTHSLLLPKLIMGRVIPPFRTMPSLRGQGEIYFLQHARKFKCKAPT